MNMGTITELGIAVHDLAETIAEWSQRTFGTDAERGPLGPLKHLEKEAREAQARPDDPKEHADCLILVLDASRRAGIPLAKLLQTALKKMEENVARKWPDPKAWIFGTPHVVDSEDCMGTPESYWRCHATLNGETVTGFGASSVKAADDCRRKTKEHPIEHVR
jgi:hypothetical protein